MLEAILSSNYTIQNSESLVEENARLRFRVSKLEQLVVSLFHSLGVLQKDSPLYKGVDLEQIQECLKRNKIKVSESVQATFVQKVAYKSKNLLYNLRKQFLENRSKKSMKYQEVQQWSHLNYRTVRKAFQKLCEMIPGAFEIRKLNRREKALCLVNEEVFLKYRVC